MTLLHALVERYDRQTAAGCAPVPGFAPAQISFTIILDAEGRYVTTQDERGDDKKRRPKVILAPAAPKRTVDIASGAFWDKTSYVFGRTAVDETVSAVKHAKDAERLLKEHAAFLARHEALLAGSEDAGLVAFLAFLRNWSPAQYDTLAYAAEMLDQNVAFRLQGEQGYIHDRPAARAALKAEAGARDAAPQAMCLVTGAVAPVARLHPSIKGVQGAQSSGAALVSFNLDAFESYGHSQGENAPVSEPAAFAYATALNGLLEPASRDAKDRPVYTNRVMLGDTTVVFWAEHGTEERLMRGMIGGQDRFAAEEEEAEDDDGGLPTTDLTETMKLRDVLSRMEEGVPLQQLGVALDEKSRAYVLGLSPNAARLSVRFWIEQNFEDFAKHFQEHWRDLRLEPRPRFWPPPLWALLREIAPQRKPENISPLLGGEIMRAILFGLPYPRALLVQTVMRIRTDQDQEDHRTGRILEKVSDLRVALLKACLARMYRWNQIAEDVPVSIDLTTTNKAYRLGRLFAVLERLQAAALGQRNATVRDRFYASASANPALVFPSLIRNARNHSKSVRTKVGAGLAEWFEDRIAEIASGLEDSFPKTLPLEEQGRFALGYYHQRGVFRIKKDVPPEIEAAEANADTSPEEE